MKNRGQIILNTGSGAIHFPRQIRKVGPLRSWNAMSDMEGLTAVTSLGAFHSRRNAPTDHFGSLLSGRS